MKRSYLQGQRRQADGIRYKHDLGQNYLYDEALLERLVAATGVGKGDSVLEIGAGAGTLTKCLARAAGRVTAVEVDDAVFPLLTLAVAGFDNVTLVKGDIRRLNIEALALGEGYFVIGNIPYNITTPILNLFFGSGRKPKQLSLMVQKEVADKLLCPPGGAEYGLMSFTSQYYCEGELVEIIPADRFTPPPKVDSAFLNLRFRESPVRPVSDEALLFRMVRAAFQLRRKTLCNALSGAAPVSSDELRGLLRSLSLSETVRGEALTVSEWIELSNLCAQRMHE